MRDLLADRSGVVIEQLGGRILPGAGEVVEQAGQFDPPMLSTLHHLGTDTAFADQQPLVDEFLDCTPGSRPRQRQPLRQRELVLEAVAGRQLTVADSVLDGLCQLIIERHRARSIELNCQGHVDSELDTGPR